MNRYLKNAKWIWAQDYDGVNMFLVAPCPFTIPTDADGDWTLYISVDSDFALLCERDGELSCLGFGQYTDYASHKVCEVRRVPAKIIAGGRLFLLLTSQNCDTSTDRRERAGVVFSLRDGTEAERWVSGEDTLLYRTARHRSDGVPLVTGQLGFSFDIDLTEPLCGEKTKTAVLTEMTSSLYPRPIAPLVMGEALPSQLVLTSAFSEQQELSPQAFGARMQRALAVNDEARADGWTYIYDLGAEQVGFLLLEISAVRACEALIGWGEHVTDGRVRTEIGGRCFAGRIRLPAGRSRLLYPLRRLGLRYLQLNVYASADEIVAHEATVCPVDYPLPTARPCPLGEEGIHAAIYKTCLRTLRLCLHDHYEDCPWREQALYTMDSRNQMLCGYYAYGETAAPRASLELIARSLREDALLELCSPARCSITIPAFSAMFVVQLAEYLAYTHDEDTGRALLPTARRIVDGFLARVDRENGLIPCYPEQQYWNFYEWQDGLEGSISGSVREEDVTYDAPLCGFVSLALDALARLYRTLGAESEALGMETHRDALKCAAHQAFYDPASALYDSYRRRLDGQRYHRAQLTQALMLLCGACPADEQARARERLMYDASLLPVTLSHSVFRYDALLADPSYLPAVMQEIEAVWGGMIRAGATTFWETAKGESDFGNAGSLCHGWSAIPVYIYWKYAAKWKNL